MHRNSKQRDKSRDHRWESLGKTQYRCKHCGMIKRYTTINGTGSVEYSTPDKVYQECIEKPDLSEWYQ